MASAGIGTFAPRRFDQAVAYDHDSTLDLRSGDRVDNAVGDREHAGRIAACSRSDQEQQQDDVTSRFHSVTSAARIIAFR